MKCPKLKKWLEIYPEQFYEEPLDCIKEECAWWNKTMEECNLVTIAVSVFDIANALEKIEAKMPHAGQFTK